MLPLVKGWPELLPPSLSDLKASKVRRRYALDSFPNSARFSRMKP